MYSSKFYKNTLGISYNPYFFNILIIVQILKISQTQFTLINMTLIRCTVFLRGFHTWLNLPTKYRDYLEIAKIIEFHIANQMVSLISFTLRPSSKDLKLYFVQSLLVLWYIEFAQFKEKDRMMFYCDQEL